MTADSKIIRFVPVSLNTFYVITSVLISFMAVFPFHYSVSFFFRYCFRLLSLPFPCSFITLFSFIVVYCFINVSVFFRQSVSVFFHYLGRVFFHCCFRFLALLFPFPYLILSFLGFVSNFLSFPSFHFLSSPEGGRVPCTPLEMVILLLVSIANL